jgi:hypothetical protein
MERWVDQAELGEMTGLIVPAYFSARPTDDTVRQLLWMTLGDCPGYLPLGNIWVVIDGDARTARLVEELRQRLLREQGATFNALPLLENRGKLWAIQEGMTALLQAQPPLRYIVIRDGDGDHAISDMPHLLRAADCLAGAYGNTRLIVVGARRSRHRPMGWVRGELEALLDQVTLDALSYHLARQGRALNLSHCLGQGVVPDLSSGYKVYGREAAQELFVEHEPCLECLNAEAYWHYGPETVAIVEGVLARATIAEAQRLTWDGQPTTSFGEFQHLALYGELLAWVFCRLGIPLEVAAQFYDNHVPAMPLRTTVEGRGLLASLRTYALERVRACRQAVGDIPPPAPLLPFL